MAIGVEITLHDADGDALASETGITALWWDEEEPADFKRPKGKATGLSTDGSGELAIDLSNVSWLTTGDYGFLLLHKGDDSDYKDSLVFASKVATSSVSGATKLETATWTRNPSWLSITAPSSAEQKIVGLHRVDPNSAYLAFTISGAYTVDWGDGTAPENKTSGSTAYHLYDYTDGDLDDTDAPVTLTDSGDVVGRTAHGYGNGMTVQFYNIASTTGLTEGQTYYVINAADDTFQVSAEPGGSAVTLTTDGTATLLPYKQVVVEITPQAANNLTSVNLNVKHNASGLQAYASGWLDLAISVPNCTALAIGGSNIRLAYLERANIVAHNDTTLVSLFNGCYSLQSVPLFDTSAVTDFQYFCFLCTNLKFIPLFDTSAATNMLGMFYQCYSLESAPTFDLTSVSNASYMFQSCYSIKSISPMTGTPSNVASMFANCYSLDSVPLLDTSDATDMNSMFYGCYSLKTVPLFDTSAATNMSYMFYNCYSLESIPEFDTSAATNFSNMFYGCYSLQSVPPLDMSAATSSSSYTNMFNGCNGLSRIEATGFKYTFTVASCKLSSAALDELYGNLGTVTSQTITVSNNVGTAADDPTIATAKGWTVTG